MKQCHSSGISIRELSHKLHILVNPCRLSIIMRHRYSESTVGTLADTTGLGLSALSQHLLKMKAAGLVQSRKENQLRYYSVTDNFNNCIIGSAIVTDLMQSSLEK